MTWQQRIHALTDEHYALLRRAMTDGAGLILTPGMEERDQIAYDLEDAARDPRHGEWESELAGLVEREDWKTLTQIVNQLGCVNLGFLDRDGGDRC